MLDLYPTPSIEAIHFQENHDLYDALVALITKGKLTTIRKDISKAISKYTNILTSIDPAVNGEAPSVVLPDIVPGHIFHDNRQTKHQLSYLNQLTSRDSVLTGSVDRRTSKVYGYFAKITVGIYISDVMLQHKEFSEQEIASVLLHEVGHIFTYFEQLSSVLITEHTISTCTDGLLRADTPVERVELLLAATAKAGSPIDRDEAKSIIGNGTPDATVVSTIILDAAITTSRLQYDANIYDGAGAEVLADQWAARHGAALPLVTILDKLHSKYLAQGYSSGYQHYALQVAKVTTACGAAGILAVVNPMLLLIVVLAAAIPQAGNAYPSPVDRLTKLRSEHAMQLKAARVSKQRVKEILYDLKLMDDIISKVRPRRDFIASVLNIIVPKRRRLKSALELKGNIEALQNNKLFETSHKLK